MTLFDPDKTAIATQLLSGMLSNPHIYATISDAETKTKGQQERTLAFHRRDDGRTTDSES